MCCLREYSKRYDCSEHPIQKRLFTFFLFSACMDGHSLSSGYRIGVYVDDKITAVDSFSVRPRLMTFGNLRLNLGIDES